MDLAIIRETPDIYKNRNNPENTPNSKTRITAIQKGQTLLDSWLTTRSQQIQMILSNFDEHGKEKRFNKNGKLEPLTFTTATTFNDLYKWTMMPVIRKLEGVKGNITVTFGIDLRDENMVKAMKSPPDLTNPLNDQILKALEGLKERKFNRELVDTILTKPRSDILTSSDIDSFCGPKDSEKSLVDIVKPFGQRPIPEDLADDKVVVSFYYRDDKSDKYGQGVHFIEATGPWHRVTWLETSMMQCVYEAKLRFDLNAQGISYGQWLYNALLRSCKSIAYTRELQQKDIPTPALFTGRRTGGLAFLLLQNLLFADHFIHDTYFNGMTASTYILPENAEKTKAIGTSSCDSWYILKNLGLPCLNPAGTHAHEMSMVTSILYPTLDNRYPIDQSNPEGPFLPMTQVLGHYLYMTLVQSKTSGPMPMLPDTLGTPAFLLAAKSLILDGSSFLSKITSARQDSGSIKSFKNSMTNIGYEGSIMASEIDDTVTLYQANELGYPTFGAGGFYGNSVKVWGDKKFSSNSMAVKAVRVSYIEPNTAGLEGIPYIILNGNLVTGYPVKIGDPEDRTKPSLDGGKLSLDKNLDDATKQAITKRAGDIRVAAWNKFQQKETLTQIPISSIQEFNPSQSGGKRKRKTRNMRRKKRTTRSK